MQEWAEKFYHSNKWQRVRAAVKARAFGLCEICGRPGLIAHHKIVLTPDNINDPDIALNTDLLVYVCHDCHNRIHGSNEGEQQRTAVFDSNGNLIDITTTDYSQYILKAPRYAIKTRLLIDRPAISHEFTGILSRV